MSSIHYFPRYSQKENMVTNNTLLLFSRLYTNSADKFKRFINAILEESGIELDTTVSFRQQEKGSGSVPDGIIEQESFKVIIETKLYGQQNIKQVENHFNSFKDEDKQVFLWVNKEQIGETYHKQIIEKINEINQKENKRISFASTTFRGICRCFKEILHEYDIEMKELIEDFEAFCADANLIDNADTKMRVVLSGATLKENINRSLYYAPSDRGYQNHKFLGLYKNKAVKAVGEVIASADIDYDFDSCELTIKEVQFGTLTDEQKKQVTEAVEQAKLRFGFLISKGHRFFFVKKFYFTEFTKITKGGLMGQRYFDLADIEGFEKGMATEEVAKLLKDREWE